jgi:hypothetical protein
MRGRKLLLVLAGLSVVLAGLAVVLVVTGTPVLAGLGVVVVGLGVVLTVAAIIFALWPELRARIPREIFDRMRTAVLALTGLILVGFAVRALAPLAKDMMTPSMSISFVSLLCAIVFTVMPKCEGRNSPAAV